MGKQILLTTVVDNLPETFSAYVILSVPFSLDTNNINEGTLKKKKKRKEKKRNLLNQRNKMKEIKRKKDKRKEKRETYKK